MALPISRRPFHDVWAMTEALRVSAGIRKTSAKRWGFDTQAKCESSSEAGLLGSRLRRLACAAAPRAHDPDAFRLALLHAVTLNVVIGIGDAHSKELFGDDRS